MQTSISFNKTPICLPSRICFYHCISHVVGTRPFSCADINSNLILYFPDAFVFLSYFKARKGICLTRIFPKAFTLIYAFDSFFPVYVASFSNTIHSISLTHSTRVINVFYFFPALYCSLLQLLHWFLLQDNSKKLSKFTYEIISFFLQELHCSRYKVYVIVCTAMSLMC